MKNTGNRKQEGEKNDHLKHDNNNNQQQQNGEEKWYKNGVITDNDISTICTQIHTEKNNSRTFRITTKFKWLTESFDFMICFYGWKSVWHCSVFSVCVCVNWLTEIFFFMNALAGMYAQAKYTYKSNQKKQKKKLQNLCYESTRINFKVHRQMHVDGMEFPKFFMRFWKLWTYVCNSQYTVKHIK